MWVHFDCVNKENNTGNYKTWTQIVSVIILLNLKLYIIFIFLHNAWVKLNDKLKQHATQTAIFNNKDDLPDVTRINQEIYIMIAQPDLITFTWTYS